MTGRVKNTGLILGLLASIISFLFFGRNQDIYQLLLLVGFLTSALFFLLILFSKRSLLSKVLWLIVVVLAILINRVTEPILIKQSFLIYLNRNDQELNAANNILSNKPGDVFILNDELTDEDGVLTPSDKEILLKIRKKLNVYMISKSENGIYYGLWGFLDVRIGITFWTKNVNPDNSYQHLKDKWYH